MVSKLTKVTNEMGFHMRPANVFVTAMTKYASNINIIVGDKNHPEVIGINGWWLALSVAQILLLNVTAQMSRLCLMKQLLLLNQVSANKNYKRCNA